MSNALTRGYTFGATELVTNSKLHQLVDNGTVTDGGLVSGIGDSNPTNLLSNGDFEAWSAGASSAPDGWVLSGSGSSVAQAGGLFSSYKAVLTRSGTDCYLVNSNYATPPKGLTYFKGRTVTFGCWVYATVANRVRISISDGVGMSFSSYHAGDFGWTFLTVTRTISLAATQLGCYCNVDTGNTAGYFDGAICVEGSSAFAFSPKPAEEGVWADYSAVSTITGWASFVTKQIFTKKIGKTVFVQYLITGTSNSTSTTFTVPYTNASILAYTDGVGIASDNTGIAEAGLIELQNSSNIVSLYKNANGNGWTASGTKSVSGQFFYEAA